MTQTSIRTMRAVVAEGGGGPEVLRVIERPVPEPQSGDVLIRVAAAGLNGADLSQRKGNYAPPPGASDIFGMEAAGTIAAVGAGVHDFVVGQRVCALLAAGGYADYVAAPAGHVLPLPEGLDFVKGAAVMETACTVWTNIFEAGALQAGETLLVHGGTSGIGTTAIQIAKARGVTVLATAGSPDKVAFCEKLGAKRGIDYRNEDFAAVVKAETKDGVDVILDIVGGSYLESNLKSLAMGGRLCIIALAGGRNGTLDIGRLMMRRLRVMGSTLRARPAVEKARLVGAVRDAVWPLLESGALDPVVDSTFPVAAVADAHRRMETSQHIGKIVLTFDTP